MELLKQIDNWMLFANNSLINVKFTIVEPNFMQILTEGEKKSHTFEFKEYEGKIILTKKNILFAIIERYNQKTLRYTEFKNNAPCFVGYLY
jgi:hypothetical protein